MDLTKSPLKKSTLKIGDKMKETKNKTTELLKYFRNYEKNHYVVFNETYLTMLGVKEAYKPINQRRTFLDNQTSYIPSLSNDKIAVYERDVYNNVELFICIKGTVITSIRDIMDDIDILKGNIRSSPFTIKYVQDCINIRKSYKNLANSQIYIGGHSLGAISSLLASFILKVNGFGYNGASTLIDLNLSSFDILGSIYNLEGIYNYSSFMSYVLKGDPIGLLSRIRIPKTIIIDVQKLNNMNAFQLHSINTMVDICIPYIPLKMESLSKARRIIPIQEPKTPTGIDALKQEQQTIRNPIEDNNLTKQFKKYLSKGIPILNLF